MGEFDLSLIHEFRSRPSFYDRNSPRFKDKLYNAHEWQEISNKLGFDVSILKDRILQLRNRYNLEKRRIEQLKEENPNKNYESPWPLYEHLHFLSDHIRARRSYRKLIPLNGGAEKYVVHDPSLGAGPDLSNSGSNNSNGNLYHSSSGGGGGRGGGEAGLSNQNISAFPNGLLAVKLEDDSDESDAETESQNNDSEVNAYEPTTVLHSSTMPQLQQRQQPQLRNLNELQQQQLQMQQQQQQQQQQQRQQQPTISIRRLDTLRSDYNNATTSSTPLNNINNSSSSRKRHHQDDNELSNAAVAAKPSNRVLSNREYKYTTFGNFVSCSLMDLPANVALELIEKFTTDVVKALKEKAQQESGGNTS